LSEAEKSETGKVVHFTPDEVAAMSREQMIESLMWSGGGAGFGVCKVGAMFLWADQRPGPDEPDWPYVVTVQGDPKIYTDDELRQLLAFSEEMTARYDRMWKWRVGANLIVIKKSAETCCWYRKQMSWEMGYMWGSTLEDACDTFRDAPASEWKRRCLAALQAGDDEAAFEIYYEKRCGDLGIRYSAMPTESDEQTRAEIMTEFRDGKYHGTSVLCRTVEELRGLAGRLKYRAELQAGDALVSE
jgi:hypothetical protein